MTDAFGAIADPTRRQILDLLRARGPQRAGDIADRFPAMSRPAVSKHLRVLRTARLCRARSAGRERVYELDSRALGDLDSWLERYRVLWRGKLDTLKTYVEQEEPRVRTRGGRGRKTGQAPRGS